MPDRSPSWSEGQVAALALIGSPVGDALPNPFASVLAESPALNTGPDGSVSAVVMIPVLLCSRARAAGALVRPGPGSTGLLVSFLTTVIVLLAYVVGLALGQPQLLKIGLSWESLRDAGLMLATTTATGTCSRPGRRGRRAGRRFFAQRSLEP